MDVDLCFALEVNILKKKYTFLNNYYEECSSV